MTDPKINYVVACWAGPRRFMHPAYAADRAIFLKLHLHQLARLRHELAAITIVVNEAPPDAQTAGFDEIVKTLDGQVLQGTPVHVLRRPNVGMSYGAWADTFLRFGETFSHYLWIEDDYVVVPDHFDVTLLELMQTTKSDYLCGFAANLGSGMHAAISNGLVSAEILARVHQQIGTLPYATTSTNYADNYRRGQIGLSRAILDVGGILGDGTQRGWAAPWMDMGRLNTFANPDGPLLIAPADLLLAGPHAIDLDPPAPTPEPS